MNAVIIAVGRMKEKPYRAMEDEYLKRRAEEKGVVRIRDIPVIRDGLALWQGDITRLAADAIVNTANPLPVVGRGTDSAIYAAAGARQLLAAREQLGPIPPGCAGAQSKLEKNSLKPEDSPSSFNSALIRFNP